MFSFAPRRTVSLALLTLVLLLIVLTLSLCSGSASTDSRVRFRSASVGDRRSWQPNDKQPNKPDTLDTSNQYGVAGVAEINQAGDYAFIGNGSSGVFFRPAGGSIRRAIQMGEPIPGIGSSRTDIISSIRMNSSGKLALLAQFNTPAGFSQATILTYQGTTLQRIVSAADIAPGTAGAIYGRNIALAGINNAGDIAFTGSLLPLGSLTTVPVQTTLFIIPNGGASVRIAGPGDTAPGTGGGTFTGITLASGTSSLNNAGEVLFRAQIVGGNSGFGLFAGSSGGVRKIVSHGDAVPGGGNFNFPGAAPNGLLNNVGQCVFTNGTYWIQAVATGITRAVGSGDAAPVALGGTLTLQTLAAINDAGTVAFTANVIGSGVTPRGVFRFVPGTGVETVAFANQGATGAAPAILSTFQAVSINQTNQVSFQAVMTGGSIARGIFLQSGAAAPVNVALEGQPSPVPGGGIFLLVSSSFTRTLDSGATYFWSDLVSGTADYAEYVGTSGSLTTLMNNADTLPAGSKLSLRNFSTQAAGDFVAFNAQQTGGKFSIVVRNVNSNVTTTPVIAGDVAPGTGGARQRAAGGFFVNSVGSIAFSSATVGGNQALASGIFVWTQGGGVAKLVQTNDVDPNSGGNFSAPSFGTFAPSPLNDANQVAFKSTVLTKVGLFVGSAGGPIQRLVQTGDNAPGGGTFSNFGGALAINQSGQVAFIATTTGGPGQNQGVFVGTPGGAVAKVVVSGDALPGGGTFFSFPSSVSFNDSGEVAFIASLGPAGTTGAVCIGTTAGALQVLARDGAASPAGGNFAITGPGVDVLINNQHDVAFRSTLSGGTSDSAYFVRRGAGPLQVVAMQGQAAPGTTGTFVTISPSLNNFLGEFFALGPTGEVAINGTFQTGAGNIVGAFRYRTDNLLEKVIVRGDVVAGTGNGLLLLTSQSFGTGGPGRFAFWEAITGGSVEDQIFVTSSPSGFGISGQVKDVSGVGIAGVQVSLSGTVSGTTTTDVAGNFSFLNLVSGGSYTVTPASSNFLFAPPNQTFNNLAVDRIANFVGTQTAFSITGNVTDAVNAPLNNAILALTKDGAAAGTVQTNATGAYSFGNLTAGSNYVVTPAGTFTPSSQTLNNLTANATANFKAAPSIPPQCATASFAGATNFAAGSGPNSVAVGDFDGDGRLDLAVANSSSTSVSILLGTGTGSFSAATNFSAGTNPFSVAVGDFNSDSKLDLAIANGNSNTVSILLGAGAGNFSAPTTFTVGPNPEAVTVGDFNGDGKLDLAVANFSSNDVSILLGTGTGGFASATNFGAGTAPISVAVGDFNGDGKLDLAAANINSSNVSILLGTGTGSFGPATNLVVGIGPHSVATGDLNGDGKLDLVVANQSVPTVSVLLGTGNGSFSAATNFAAGSGPESVALGDFNADGKLDVAINNPGASVQVMLGNGDGSLGSTTNFAAGSAPGSVVIGDFNGDGKNDLAVANFASNNISALVNNGSLCNTQNSLTISGHISTATNNPLADVTVTLAGPITRVTATDINGNYSFANLVPGGNYSVTVQSTYFVVAPSRFDFFNLSSTQAANFTAAPVAVPQPSPPPSDNFTSTTRDASKWTIGTQTASPVAFDPQVTTAQINGQLVISPVPQAVGLHFGGYASANAFDLRNGKINVEVVKTASGGADTIFAIGSDSDNFYRFMVHSAGTPTSLAPIARRPNGTQGPLDEAVPLLIFQVKINGQLTSLSINYDPVQHRFMRFRHLPLLNSIVFETSPNDIDYVVRYTVVLQKGVSALTAELSAGTSNPANPGTAVFDNFGLVTSTFQFNASNYAVSESDGLVTVTVTRSGSTATPATVDFATADGTALQRTRYINTAGRLSFAAGELSKTFTVLVEDNAFAEGNQTVNLLLMNPTGSGLNSPGRALIDIADNDTSLAIGNPLDDPRFFVQQNYFDFLSRFPDQGGSDFWTSVITGPPACPPNDQICLRDRRITVSNAFFFELEFQQTGAYVFRVYRTAFGNNQPFPNPDANPQFPGQNVRLPSYDAFARDRAQVVGGSSLAQSQLDLANAFVLRPEFLAKYPANLDGPAFVDAMLATIMNDLGVNLSSQRTALIDLYNQGGLNGRGNVLYRLADDNVQTNPINNRPLIDAEYIRSFVATQYFGYLRRDADIGGFLFWLGQVNSAPLRDLSKQRAMVCSFITSAEYQQRFSAIATHTNQECQ